MAFFWASFNYSFKNIVFPPIIFQSYFSLVKKNLEYSLKFLIYACMLYLGVFAVMISHLRLGT